MTEKINTHLLQRRAYVYVRQSSAYQVRYRQEGRQRQCALAGQARQLGFVRVTVIDDNLGRSAAGRQERPGFARLLAAVCQVQAGAVPEPVAGTERKLAAIRVVLNWNEKFRRPRAGLSPPKSIT